MHLSVRTSFSCLAFFLLADAGDAVLFDMFWTVVVKNVGPVQRVSSAANSFDGKLCKNVGFKEGEKFLLIGWHSNLESPCLLA